MDIQKENNVINFFDKIDKKSESKENKLDNLINKMDEKLNKFKFKDFEEFDSTIDMLNSIKNEFEKLKNFNSIADPKTKKMIEAIFPLDVFDLDILRKHVKEIENRIKYIVVPESNTMNSFVSSFGTFNKTTCVIDIYSPDKGTVKTNNLTYEITNFPWLKDQISVSTSKLLVYAVKQLNFNSNISKFTFNEYANMRGIGDSQVNRDILKQDVEILEKLGRIKYESTNKRDNDLILTTLVYKAVYKAGNVIIEFNPEFVEGLKNTYMYFPKSLMKLKGKEFSNVFLLGWYLFTQLRINFTTTLTRSVKSCLLQLSLPKKDDITDRMYQRRLIEPFEKIIDNLSDKVPELYIEFDQDYKNITEFLDSNIIIELKESKISQLYLQQQKKKLKKSKKSNIDKKLQNIKLCNEYIKQGKTIKEISKIMDKSIRTIERYMRQNEK